MLSITSLTNDIKRTLEPRAASPLARLRVVEQLAQAGIPVGVLVAPVIPAITDHEMEDILAAAKQAGAAQRRLCPAAAAARGEGHYFASGWTSTIRTAPST